MTQALIVLQARTSSRRLPAKALISFRGYPLAILAALRAGNQGHRVVLATSDDPSDDLLVAAAAEHGVACLRGSLNDVLGRFCMGLGEVADDTPVVRLTGDNIVPDGALIAEVVAAMQAANVGYMAVAGKESGLPYGVSVEATYAGHLRSADRAAMSRHAREHVTPWIRKTQGVAHFDAYAGLGLASFRMTVDTVEDLASMHRVFPATGDPVAVPWREIVARAPLGSYQPGPHAGGGKLVLGTAQLGMAYGIARAGSPGPEEGRDLIRHAIANGVGWIDTARAYGQSESVLGAVLGAGWDGRARVVTKLSPLAQWQGGDPAKGVRAAAEASLLTSCRDLQSPRLDTVLLHRAAHWTAWGGAVAELLLEWQEAGRIGTVGVSVQSPEEMEAALDEPAIGHVQMPFNIVDPRWDGLIPALIAARASRELVVHVRSALLQGLLTSDSPGLWARAHVDAHELVRDWLTRCARETGQQDIPALCLNWCRAQHWADGVVVGMDNRAQLDRNLEIFSGTGLAAEELAPILQDRPVLGLNTLDPACWAERGDTQEGNDAV